MARATFQVEITCDIGVIDPQELMADIEAAVRTAESPGWTDLVEAIGAGEDWRAEVACTDAWSVEEDEAMTCRVCGCTDEAACPGGCWWVPDPEMLGDLCSACRPEPDDDPLTATDPSGADTRQESEGRR